MEKAVREEFQEIRSLFRDIGKQFQETREQFRETDERFDKRAQQTEKEFAELRKQFKETDESLRKQFKETDERLDKQFRETDRRLDKRVQQTEKQIGALGNRWGRFVENIIVPGIKDLFLERNLTIRHFHQRVRASRNGKNMEIDILAVNGEFVILIEVKSSLTVEDVKHTIAVLNDFRFFLPEYRERKILGAVAGIGFEEDSDRFAYRNGLFVIGQKGDNAVFLNDTAFQPKAY